MKNLIAVFACAKNEHIYITEWIYYHLKIGLTIYSYVTLQMIVI